MMKTLVAHEMAGGKFHCLQCGRLGACMKGSVVLCVQGDLPAGVCADCLLSYTMEAISVAPEYAKLLTPQSRKAILLQTAEAKAKMDLDFCFDDYIDDVGLREIYEICHK